MFINVYNGGNTHDFDPFGIMENTYISENMSSTIHSVLLQFSHSFLTFQFRIQSVSSPAPAVRNFPIPVSSRPFLSPLLSDLSPVPLALSSARLCLLQRLRRQRPT